MTQSTKNKIPGPVYAAAGAGHLAYRRLRRLPAMLGGLTGKAVAGTADLREKAAANSAELREKAAAGTTELREAARRNASAVVAGAQSVQEKATAVYGELVVRGTRVIGRSADAEPESEGAARTLPAAPKRAPATQTAAEPVKKVTKRTRPPATD